MPEVDATGLSAMKSSTTAEDIEQLQLMRGFSETHLDSRIVC